MASNTTREVLYFAAWELVSYAGHKDSIETITVYAENDHAAIIVIKYAGTGRNSIFCDRQNAEERFMNLCSWRRSKDFRRISALELLALELTTDD